MTTQVQIDQLKADWKGLAAAVSVLAKITETMDADINVLTPDVAPIPVPTPTPSAGLWTEYCGAWFGNKTFHTVAVDANGVPPPGPLVPGAIYVSLAVPGEGEAVWGTSGEHYRVMTATDGVQWGVVYAYENVNLSQRYPLETVRAEWINLTTGVVKDIANVTPGKSGTVMCPLIIPNSGKFRLREWFWTCNPDGSRANSAFWQADFEFGIVYTNHAWTGDGPQMRQCFKMLEAWWDAGGGWIRGHSSPAALPWANGAPAEVTIIYDGWQAFGRGAGILWAYQYPDYKIALASIT
jgi:hypothetical protein